MYPEIAQRIDKIQELNQSVLDSLERIEGLKIKMENEQLKGDGGKLAEGWERTVTESEIEVDGKKVKVGAVCYKEKKVELAGDEYVCVWDSCGIKGYLIPWAAWKAQGILPISDRKRYVDTKFVNLLARESVGQRSFDSAAKGMPIVFLDDFETGKAAPRSWEGINWEAVRVAIIKAARERFAVRKVTPQPPYEEIEAKWLNTTAELQKAKQQLNDYVQLTRLAIDQGNEFKATAEMLAETNGKLREAMNELVELMFKHKVNVPLRDVSDVYTDVGLQLPFKFENEKRAAELQKKRRKSKGKKG